MWRTLPFIVAEVSKTWIRGCGQSPLLLCEQFELVVNVNHRRGYRLHSFQLHQLMGDGQMVETIIAVFERADAQSTDVHDAMSTSSEGRDRDDRG